MEIVQIDKCNISDDIIKYKLKEWLLFHENNKIIDINNFEIVENTLQKKLRIQDVYNSNFDYFDYENKFINYILYNKELVSIGFIDFGNTTVFITNLLLSDICDWYNIIYNIIMFYNNKYKYEMIYINFNDYMDTNHLIINDIMNILNIPYIKQDYEQKKYYVLKLKNYNYKYTNSFNINIIGYKHQTKTEENLLFNHISNIGILFNENQPWALKDFYSYFDSYFDNYRDKLPNIIDHNVSVYDIILEKPIIIDRQIDDIFIDIEINLKNNKFKIDNDNSYNLRLNKLLTNTVSSIGYEYINSISCYKRNCKCYDCKNIYKKNITNKTNKLNKEEITEINKQYYYGNNPSNYILYNFICNNFKYNYKKYDNFEYNNIVINKPDKQLNLEKLNILDLYNIFNNNIIEENKKPQIILNNYIYLIQKYDVNLKKDLYKFGKTNRPFNDRIKEYGPGVKVLIILDVDNCHIFETNILKVLKSDSKIINADITNEYFYCDNKQHIINIILKNILN